MNQHLFKVTSSKYDKWFYYAWTKHHLDRFVAVVNRITSTVCLIIIIVSGALLIYFKDCDTLQSLLIGIKDASFETSLNSNSGITTELCI